MEWSSLHFSKELMKPTHQLRRSHQLRAKTSKSPGTSLVVKKWGFFILEERKQTKLVPLNCRNTVICCFVILSMCLKIQALDRTTKWSFLAMGFCSVCTNLFRHHIHLLHSTGPASHWIVWWYSCSKNSDKAASGCSYYLGKWSETRTIMISFHDFYCFSWVPMSQWCIDSRSVQSKVRLQLLPTLPKG